MSDDEIIDAEWEEVPDADAPRAPSRNRLRPTGHSAFVTPPQTKNAGSRWRTKAFWVDMAETVFVGGGDVVLIVFVLAALVFLAWKLDLPFGSSASAPATEIAPGTSGVQQDGEQMLRSWTNKVTGRSDTVGFAMINGGGKPGEFCNNSNGDTMIKFGGETTGYNDGITIFDFFGEFHGQTNSGVIGEFWYDTSDDSLLTRNRADISNDGKKGKSLPDVAHTFDTDGEGRATIDGTTYHECTI